MLDIGYSSILTQPLRWIEKSGQRHALAAARQGRKSGTHLSGRWVGPRGGLETLVPRKSPRPGFEICPLSRPTDKTTHTQAYHSKAI